jgi:hypothetical protein
MKRFIKGENQEAALRLPWTTQASPGHRVVTKQRL